MAYRHQVDLQNPREEAVEQDASGRERQGPVENVPATSPADEIEPGSGGVPGGGPRFGGRALRDFVIL